MKHLPVLSLLAITLAACGGTTTSSSPSSTFDSSGSASSASSLSSSISTSQATSILSIIPTSIVSSSIESTSVTTSNPPSSNSSTNTSTPSSQNVIVGISRALFAFVEDLPDTDSYLPSFLNAETYQTTKQVSNLNYYTGSINKVDLPSTYFGAQLDQLRSHIGFMDGLTENLTTMLSKTSAIGNLYSDYLSGNPQNPYSFSVSLDGFSFLITGLENELVVKVTVGEASVTMAVLNIQGVITYWIDVMINQDNRVVIYTTPTRLAIIGNVLVSAIKVSYLLEILKDGNSINGYSYERYGTESTAIRQHVVFKTDGDYFVVAGERGDFILGASPKVNVETYDKTTGKYLGSQVLETIPVTGPTYETIWYPMWSINGWNSIRFEADNNDAKEFPQVYLNGSNSVFDVHYNSVLGVSTSRKYDIELKKSYVYIQNNNQWQKQEFLYPAFFIQQNEITVSAPFGTANSRNSNVFSHSLTTALLSAIRSNYQTMKTNQAAYKLIDVDSVISNFLFALS
jgi:hypothetical protein